MINQGGGYFKVLGFDDIEIYVERPMDELVEDTSEFQSYMEDERYAIYREQ